jgi:hypothetical protein
MLATPAQAHGKKKQRHHDWNDGGYTCYGREWDDPAYWDSVLSNLGRVGLTKKKPDPR